MNAIQTRKEFETTLSDVHLCLNGSYEYCRQTCTSFGGSEEQLAMRCAAGAGVLYVDARCKESNGASICWTRRQDGGAFQNTIDEQKESQRTSATSDAHILLRHPVNRGRQAEEAHSRHQKCLCTLCLFALATLSGRACDEGTHGLCSTLYATALPKCPGTSQSSHHCDCPHILECRTTPNTSHQPRWPHGLAPKNTSCCCVGCSHPSRSPQSRLNA